MNATGGLAHWLVAQRYVLLAVALAWFGVAWHWDRQLVFDRQITQLFPDKDPAVAAYRQLRDALGGDEVILLTYAAKDLMEPSGEGLRFQDGLDRQIEAIPGVRGVVSLQKVNQALLKFQPHFGPVDPTQTPAILADDKLAIALRHLFQNYTHSSAGDYAAIVILLDVDSATDTDSVIEQLHRVCDTMPSDAQPACLVGEPVMVREGFALVAADGRRLGRVTLVLLSIALLLMFGSFRWVLIQCAVIYWAVISTRAVVTIIGMELTLVSSMLTAVITVIAVASIIHLAVADRDARHRGLEPRASTAAMFARVLKPIAWACATDAVGFASLWISDVGPVRDFGIMMAIGAMVVVSGIVLLVPALASLSLPGPSPKLNLRQLVVQIGRVIPLGPLAPQQRVMPSGGSVSRRLDRCLGHTAYAAYQALAAHRTGVLLALIPAAIVIMVGLNRLTIETNFIRNFRADHPLARDYTIVESQLGGAGVWDIMLPAPAVLTSEYLDSVRSLEQKLRDLPGPGLSSVISIADADAAFSKTPLLAMAPTTLRIAGMQSAMPHLFEALFAPANKHRGALLRVSLRSNEQVPSELREVMIRAVQKTANEHAQTEQWRKLFPESQPPATIRVTGYYVLLSALVSGLVADQWVCFAIASFGVFVMLCLVAGSLRLAVFAMVPNMLPILSVLAVLGFWGDPVNLGTAMIAAVSIGISIDGSIHFLIAFSRNHASHNVHTAIARVYRSVGLAVILSTVSLVIGFSTLATSPFIPTATFGILVSVSLVASSIANLTLLPLGIPADKR